MPTDPSLAASADRLAPIAGLVLAGGASRRMGRDKAALEHAGQTQLARLFDLLSRHLPEVRVAVRSDQQAEPLRRAFPQVLDLEPTDALPVGGPMAGLLGAFAYAPDHAWLVVACDLPLLDDAAILQLLAEREPNAIATAYTSSHDGLPEPLCALWEPAAAAALRAHVATGNLCPRKFLLRHHAHLLSARSSVSTNINTPAELTALAAMAEPSTLAEPAVSFSAPRIP